MFPFEAFDWEHYKNTLQCNTANHLDFLCFLQSLFQSSITKLQQRSLTPPAASSKPGRHSPSPRPSSRGPSPLPVSRLTPSPHGSPKRATPSPVKMLEARGEGKTSTVNRTESKKKKVVKGKGKGKVKKAGEEEKEESVSDIQQLLSGGANRTPEVSFPLIAKNSYTEECNMLLCLLI